MNPLLSDKKGPSFGTGLDFITNASHKCEAAPRRARFSGSETFVSLNSRLESNQEEEGEKESPKWIHL